MVAGESSSGLSTNSLESLKIDAFWTDSNSSPWQNTGLYKQSKNKLFGVICELIHVRLVQHVCLYIVSFYSWMVVTTPLLAVNRLRCNVHIT